jgi:hypothetical protein
MTETTGQKKLLGTFRGEKLHSEFLRAAHTRNNAAFGMAYVNTARAIMEEYPELALWERRMQFGLLQHQIQLTKVRTKRDDSRVLGELSRTLRITAQK